MKKFARVFFTLIAVVAFGIQANAAFNSGQTNLVNQTDQVANAAAQNTANAANVNEANAVVNQTDQVANAAAQNTANAANVNEANATINIGAANNMAGTPAPIV